MLATRFDQPVGRRPTVRQCGLIAQDCSPRDIKAGRSAGAFGIAISAKVWTNLNAERFETAKSIGDCVGIERQLSPFAPSDEPLGPRRHPMFHAGELKSSS
jgi:hypothetical protein